MKATKAVLMVLLVGAVTLAGCTDSGNDDGDDGDTVDGTVDKDTTKLDAGKGALSGLLLNDAFRPIHLVETPNTEFQAQGFILIQELGKQVSTTSENGEFSVLNIEPGTYTIRASISGHEFSPQQVTIEAGLFAEERLIARRVANTGTIILTEEHAGFIPCAVAGGGASAVFGCVDASGDAYRPDITVDYSEYVTGDNNTMTYVVVEMMVQKEEGQRFTMIVRPPGTTSQGDAYGVGPTDASGYAKTVLMVSDDEVFDADQNPNPWNGTPELEMVAFYSGEDSTDGAGFATGIRFDVLVSIFLGEPEQDIANYRILTGS